MVFNACHVIVFGKNMSHKSQQQQKKNWQHYNVSNTFGILIVTLEPYREGEFHQTFALRANVI